MRSLKPCNSGYAGQCVPSPCGNRNHGKQKHSNDCGLKIESPSDRGRSGIDQVFEKFSDRARKSYGRFRRIMLRALHHLPAYQFLQAGDSMVPANLSPTIRTHRRCTIYFFGPQKFQVSLNRQCVFPACFIFTNIFSMLNNSRFD